MSRPDGPVRRLLNPLARQRRYLVWPALVALAAGLTWGSPAGADGDSTGLPEAMDTILGDPSMEGGAASVVVADASSGDILYQHNPTGRLMPASNTKLLTSTAATELLGTGYRFTTDVLSDGRQRGASSTAISICAAPATRPPSPRTTTSSPPKSPRRA